MTNTNETGTTPQQVPSTQLPLDNFSFTDGISIITHNIQGANNQLKLQIWIEYYHESNFHIIALTETKLTNSNSNHTNPLYYFFYANFTLYNNEQRASCIGTALVV